MKTICPHCKQEFPEIPDEYLNMSLECTVCHKNFICRKPKFCAECGGSNLPDAIKCIRCGKLFPVIPTPMPRPQQSAAAAPAVIVSHQDDSILEDVGLFTAWRKIFCYGGRSRRKEYFFFILTNIVILLALNWLPRLTGTNLPKWAPCVWSVPMGLAGFSLLIRRLHDMGNSGWWIFLFLPFNSLFFGLPGLLTSSQPGANEWGPNPAGIPDDGKSRSRAGNAVAITIGGIIAILAYASLAKALPAALSESKEKALRVVCHDNLKQIAAAVEISCGADGKYPADLRELLSQKHLKDSNCLECPSSHKGYVYFGCGQTGDGSDDIPLAMDEPLNHDGKYVNILLLNGAVTGHILPHEMTSCVEILNELFPQLSQSPRGRIVLENAAKEDQRLKNGGHVETATPSESPAETDETEISEVSETESDTDGAEKEPADEAEDGEKNSVITLKLPSPDETAARNRALNETLDALKKTTDELKEKNLEKAEQDYKTAEKYIREKNKAKALKFLRRSANAGYAKAQNEMGLYCAQSERDYEQAVSWYRKAAEQGFADAQNNLGLCYFEGHGVAVDHKQAVSWFEKAAGQGLAMAQNNLGLCYADGNGVAVDYKQAVSWFRKAASQGLANSQYSLGKCYANGFGVPKNRKKAVFWYKKAAEQGYEDAKKELRRLEN
ncbi:MAG: SEL1-like repeat protein [Lentisphaeria bacterium]|nr:SEL1-like repeat protein [Lentisphaeria bacterium]